MKHQEDATLTGLKGTQYRNCNFFHFSYFKIHSTKFRLLFRGARYKGKVTKKTECQSAKYVRPCVLSKIFKDQDGVWQALKMPVNILVSHIKVPEFVIQLCFQHLLHDNANLLKQQCWCR